jgi:hypothetical protein
MGGKITDKIREKKMKNLILWKAGDPSPNPAGRPKGQLNFSTLYRMAIEKIALSNGLDPDAYELEIVEKAVKKASDGDIRFYQDTMDRVHGKPIQSIDHTSGGKAFTFDDIRTLLDPLTPDEQDEFFNTLDKYVTIAERRRSLGPVQGTPAKQPRGNKKKVQG